MAVLRDEFFHPRQLWAICQLLWSVAESTLGSQPRGLGTGFREAEDTRGHFCLKDILKLSLRSTVEQTLKQIEWTRLIGTLGAWKN